VPARQYIIVKESWPYCKI